LIFRKDDAGRGASWPGKGFHGRKLGLGPSDAHKKLKQDVPILLGEPKAHRDLAVGTGPVFLDDQSSTVERHPVQHQTPAFFVKAVPQRLLIVMTPAAAGIAEDLFLLYRSRQV